MKANKRKTYLQEIIKNYLKTGKSVIELLRENAKSKSERDICNKSISKCEEAIVHIDCISHIEVLEYLYSIFIGNNVVAYSVSGGIASSKKLKEFDTDEHIGELIEIIEENKKKQIAKVKAMEESKKTIDLAKKEGKKIEMVYDKETKTVKPLIVEEKPQA